MALFRKIEFYLLTVLLVLTIAGLFRYFTSNASAGIETNQNASLVIGQPDFVSNSSNQGGSAAANTVNFPYSVATNGTQLAVVDYGNNRVLIYNTIPTSNNNPAADVVIGQANFTSTSANQGGSRGANTLSSPINALFVDEKLLILDYGNSRVLIYNTVPTTNNASANVVIGQANFTSGSANQGSTAGANTLNNPYGITYNRATDKLVITDTNNNRVLLYDGIPTSNNASADVVVGQSNFTTRAVNQGGSAAANTLNIPQYSKIIGNKLYVSDSYNSRVLIYNPIPTTNNASADQVIGQANFTSTSGNQGGSAAANTLNFPGDIEFDGTKLYIADAFNYRILGFNTLPTSNNPSASFVIGQPNFTSSSANQGAGPAANTFEYLESGIFHEAGKLFVADNGNNRILVFYDHQYGQQGRTSNNSEYFGGPTIPQPPGCSSKAPASSPFVFRAEAYSDRISFYFTPLKSDVSSYVVGYGYEFDHQLRFGTEFGQGIPTTVESFTIGSLEPNVTYFFGLRAQNGCAPGNWGRVLVIKTAKKGQTTPKIMYY